MTDVKTFQQAAREQYKVAENAATSAWRTWVDLAATSSAYRLDALEQGLNYNATARAQADRLASEALSSYRDRYQQGLKSWQSYIQGVNEIINRAGQS